jgi:hypothetical protein
MRLNTLFLALLAWCITTPACSASGDVLRKNEETPILKGTIRVVGNEPFTRLFLTVPTPGERCRSTTEYIMKGALVEELRRHYQGKVVTLEYRRCQVSLPDNVSCIEPERIVCVE